MQWEAVNEKQTLELSFIAKKNQCQLPVSVSYNAITYYIKYWPYNGQHWTSVSCEILSSKSAITDMYRILPN